MSGANVFKTISILTGTGLEESVHDAVIILIGTYLKHYLFVYLYIFFFIFFCSYDKTNTSSWDSRVQ